MQGGLFYLVMVGAVGAVGAFHIQHTDQSENQVAAGGVLSLTCKANSYFEYCSWTHSPDNRECHFEWKRMKNRVIMQDCHSELKHKVSLRGNYKSHECSIEISGFEARDAGTWTCEMEEYVFAGQKGSGNRDIHSFTVGLLSTTTIPTTTTNTSPSTTISSSRAPATTITPPLTVMTERTSADTTVTSQPDTEAEDWTEQDSRREETTELSSPGQETQEDLEGESTIVTEKFVQSDEEYQTAGSNSLVGIICGVAVVVLAAGAVAAVLGWRRRQAMVQTVTMSKLIEDGEARGILLEENEFNNPPVDRVLINSLP